MTAIKITAFELAQRFLGVREASGSTSNAHVLAMLRLDATWVTDDAVAWCSAFVNYICWLLRLPRSKSLAARSWLVVGQHVSLKEAVIGFDVVVLKRGPGEQPGPEVLAAPGHVGFYAGQSEEVVYVLGGNQGDKVSVEAFPISKVLDVRRVA